MADKLDDGMVALIALAADEVDKAYEKQAEMARLARMEVRKQQEAEFKSQMEENEEILRHGFTK